jgi:biotin transport system substrate-specific component
MTGMKPKFAVRDLILIAMFAALTAILTYVSIPMPGGLPAITGQTFAVMLAGLLLGARKAAYSQIIYILIGVAGVPVFSNGRAGFGVLVSASGGFLWGFVMGAYVIGKLTEKRKQPSMLLITAAAFLGGVLVVYIPGVWQMARVLELPLGRALVMMVPYIPGDFVKVAASVLVAQAVMKSMPALSPVNNNR